MQKRKPTQQAKLEIKKVLQKGKDNIFTEVYVYCQNEPNVSIMYLYVCF